MPNKYIMPNKLSQYTFYLLRHGESIWNYEKRFTGWTNVPLTYKGISQSKQVINTLNNYNIKPNIIYTSQLYRALQTSCIIKEDINYKYNNDKKIKIIQNWRLNEKNYGSLEGIKHSDFEKYYGKNELNNVIYKFDHPPPLIRNIFCDKNYQQLLDKYIYLDNKLNDSYKITNFYSLYNTNYKPYVNYYLKHIINGETNKVVMDRVLLYFFNAIFPGMQKGEIPLIICHKHTGRVMLKHFLNINSNLFEKCEFHQNELYEITIDENKKLKILNCINLIE